MRFALLILSLTLLITVSACGGSEQATPASNQGGGAAAGQTLFVTNCSACHGPAGEGIQGLGKPLTASQFIDGLSDEELLEFIKTGRAVNDPLNTSGIAMPPKGGNPALTDEQLSDIVAYIRSIHKN